MISRLPSPARPVRATSRRASPAAPPAWLLLGDEDLTDVALLEQFVGPRVRHHACRDDPPLRTALDDEQDVGRLPAEGPAPRAAAHPHAPAEPPGAVRQPELGRLPLVA